MYCNLLYCNVLNTLGGNTPDGREAVLSHEVHTRAQVHHPRLDSKSLEYHHRDRYPDNPHLYHLDHVTHEHSEDDEGDEVGIREFEHPQQRDEDGLTSDVDDAADAVVVRVLNRAPMKPVVRIKDF